MDSVIPVYVVVDDGCEVNIFRSFEKLWEHIQRCVGTVEARFEFAPFTEENLRSIMKTELCVRLYLGGQRDWRYKIVKENV